MFPDSTTEAILPFLQKAIRKAFEKLLSEKHLYQAVEVELTPLGSLVEGFIRQEEGKRAAAFGGSGRPRLTIADFQRSAQRVLNMRWEPVAAANPFEVLMRSAAVPELNSDRLILAFPTIRTVCDCGGVWPFNPVTGAIKEQSGREPSDQCYFVPYECQNCKGDPTRFLIRRQGAKLRLCGRDPFEKISVPNFLPKPMADFYGSAQVAHNAGQTLAGIFLLRVFIEQYWRSLDKMAAALKRNDRLPGDEMSAIYLETLPEDFKSRFPSLKDGYDRLSDAMHRADPDAKLFAVWSEKIVEHFEARKLFRL